jgi:hypothetical protein
MAEQEQPVVSVDDPQGSPEVEAPDTEGRLLRGVMRFRGHERRLAKLAAGPEDELIEHRGLAALVHPVPYRLPDWDRERLREHSSVVERAMRRTTIVPAPYGIVFRGRDQVVDFLSDHKFAVEEVLAFFDGTFEMRLHIQPSGKRPDISESLQADTAASFYTALRRRSRAAFTLPTSGNRLLSGAFLVGRADWVHFVEYADQLDADHPEFLFDLTGPWPPYDFVKMAFYPKDESGE